VNLLDRGEAALRRLLGIISPSEYFALPEPRSAGSDSPTYFTDDPRPIIAFDPGAGARGQTVYVTADLDDVRARLTTLRGTLDQMALDAGHAAEALGAFGQVMRAVDPRATREWPRPAPEARAWALFDSLLTPEQRASWQAGRSCEVQGSAGGRYEITAGRNGNVYEIGPEGWRRRQLCAGPDWPTPLGDYLAGQLLSLRHDEPGFLRVANVLREFIPTGATLDRAAWFTGG
jgi:hypothetical protein